MNNNFKLLDILLFPLYLVLGVFFSLLWVVMVVGGAVKTWMEDKML
jgi:hypothetical protein